MTLFDVGLNAKEAWGRKGIRLQSMQHRPPGGFSIHV